MGARAVVTPAELELAAEYERWLHGVAFARSELRHSRLKRRVDCGCMIDGGEPYRYQVWRDNAAARGVIEQRTDCEPCSRVDSPGWRW